MSNTERSASRGRKVFQSSGKGGLGNIRQASHSRGDTRPDGPDDFSSSRGREPAVGENKASSSTQKYTTGRGGAGNIRSQTRDLSTGAVHTDTEKEAIRDYVAASQDTPHSTGRGGLGNSTRSRSRGPGSPPAVHSTGRGGAGNILPGNALAAELNDEDERIGLSHSADGVHSTGRGGAANLTSIPSPGVEHIHHSHGEYESTGRGGAGNIIRDTSRERGI